MLCCSLLLHSALSDLLISSSTLYSLLCTPFCSALFYAFLISLLTLSSSTLCSVLFCSLDSFHSSQVLFLTDCFLNPSIITDTTATGAGIGTETDITIADGDVWTYVGTARFGGRQRERQERRESGDGGGRNENGGERRSWHAQNDQDNSNNQRRRESWQSSQDELDAAFSNNNSNNNNQHQRKPSIGSMPIPIPRAPSSSQINNNHHDPYAFAVLPPLAMSLATSDDTRGLARTPSTTSYSRKQSSEDSNNSMGQWNMSEPSTPTPSKENSQQDQYQEQDCNRDPNRESINLSSVMSTSLSQSPTPLQGISM
jgi:hypothetical protein